jgi:hypothetical protein
MAYQQRKWVFTCLNNLFNNNQEVGNTLNLLQLYIHSKNINVADILIHVVIVEKGVML